MMAVLTSKTMMIPYSKAKKNNQNCPDTTSPNRVI